LGRRDFGRVFDQSWNIPAGGIPNRKRQRLVRGKKVPSQKRLAAMPGGGELSELRGRPWKEGKGPEGLRESGKMKLEGTGRREEVQARKPPGPTCSLGRETGGEKKGVGCRKIGISKTSPFTEDIS